MIKVIKAKRQLVKFITILRLKVLSIKTQSMILETFIEPFLLYDLPTVVYGKVDVNRLKAVQSAA